MLDVWAQMDNHLRKADLGAARRAILEAIADVAYFQLERALDLAAQTIHDAGLDKDPEGQELDPEVVNLISALVPILRHLAYTYQYAGPAGGRSPDRSLLEVGGDHHGRGSTRYERRGTPQVGSSKPG